MRYVLKLRAWQYVVEVKLNQQTVSLPMVVLEGNSPSLFGQNWIRLIWSEIYHIGLGVEKIKANQSFKVFSVHKQVH